MEGGEVGGGLRVAPRGLAQGVDHEGGAHDRQTADDEHRIPDRVAACGDLSGRHEAQNEGQQRPAEAQAAEQPHEAVAFAEPEGAGRGLHLVAQHDRCREHEHIHDQVEQYGKLRENLIERLHGGHHHEEQCEQRHDASLHEENVALHAVAVGLLEERRQVARLADGEDALRGARDPGQHTGQHAEHERHGDHGRGPRKMQVAEVVVEADEQRLREADVPRRDDEPQREGSQNEDADRDERADDDGPGVVAARVFDVHDVYAHHLHAGVEEEDAAGEHQVVEFREIGEETLRKVHVVVASGGQVDRAQYDEQSGGDDRADHAAPFADLADPVQSLERNEGGDPVDDQHHDEREGLVRGQRHVMRLVHADEGDRHGSEGQDGGIPDRRFDPLQPDGQKTRARSVGLADPAEHAALLVGEHGGQLGGDHGRRNEEHDGCEQVIEGRG